MDAAEIKEYIFKNQMVEFVLTAIGCHDIEYHPGKDYYSCANYDGDNVGAINVRNSKYLNVKNYTREKDFDENSDIISLVQYNKKCSFLDAVKYLHKALGIKYTWDKKQKTKEEKIDPLYIFKKHKSRNYVDVSDIDLCTIKEEMLDNYEPLLHISWFKEGVMPWTRRKFGICYSYRRSRVIIPMRHWKSGVLLGTNARTTVENYEIFGIKKYDITSSYRKSWNLYGLYENRKSIEAEKIVTIVEAEKSVLKRDSRFDSTLVALSGKTISREQVCILKTLQVNEIVVALDNDVPIEEVWYICDQFYGFRKVSYIKDSWGLLGKKDSPADANNKSYKFLFDNRIIYNAEKQMQYRKTIKAK